MTFGSDGVAFLRGIPLKTNTGALIDTEWPPAALEVRHLVIYFSQ